MSLEDPFFVVKGEVQKAVNTARGLYQRWTELLQEEALVSKEELDWTTNELRNSLRSIEWDLEDLEETIGIVESNPRKFKIEGDEVAGRRAFVESTRDTVREMKDHISSPSAVAKTERKSCQALLGGGPSRGGVQADRYTLLDQDLGNSRYIEDQQAQQQLIVEQQDEQLELVSGSIRVLKNMSGRIGDELDEQAVMLGEFSEEMDQTSSRMDSVLKKMEKVSHMTSSRRQWCAIAVLAVILVVVLILLFTL
ncbi:syntaxin-6-like [Acipenser ruthenus]|nr:syntaxin-6-like [Acipenser ruthenus]